MVSRPTANLNYAGLALKEIEAILVSPNSMWRKTAEHFANLAPSTFASAYPVTKTRLGFSIAGLAAKTDL